MQQRGGFEVHPPELRPVLRPHTAVETSMLADEVALAQAAGSPSLCSQASSGHWDVGFSPVWRQFVPHWNPVLPKRRQLNFGTVGKAPLSVVQHGEVVAGAIYPRRPSTGSCQIVVLFWLEVATTRQSRLQVIPGTYYTWMELVDVGGIRDCISLPTLTGLHPPKLTSQSALQHAKYGHITGESAGKCEQSLPP